MDQEYATKSTQNSPLSLGRALALPGRTQLNEDGAEEVEGAGGTASASGSHALRDSMATSGLLPESQVVGRRSLERKSEFTHFHLH